jgi:DNA-binding response OmpR family regulator
MKKVLIAKELHSILLHQSSFLNRSGMQVFPFSSNDELLEVHRSVQADLIITQLDLPGMGTEQLFARMREEAGLHSAPLLMVCPNTGSAIEQCSRCGAAAVILRPVNPLVLLAKAQQLLAIAWRETFRALVNVVVEGHAGNSMFFCRSRDISVSGILLETEKRLDRGSRISCSFYLPESAQVQATAEVVRTVNPLDQKAPHQYGLKFLQMNAEHRRALEMFIHAKSLPSSNA